ncbi:hypothetical protein J7J18_04385 [bacterium]|nr:hypothetical protein [bacterium]
MININDSEKLREIVRFCEQQMKENKRAEQLAERDSYKFFYKGKYEAFKEIFALVNARTTAFADSILSPPPPPETVSGNVHRSRKYDWRVKIRNIETGEEKKITVQASSLAELHEVVRDNPEYKGHVIVWWNIVERS